VEKGIAKTEDQGSFREKILVHLQEILISPSFKSSARSKQFLEYVVLHSLEDQPELLKERLIGERIFNRPVDYDTGQDSIVRVKANEVRRRLAQFYDLHSSTPLRIDLPSGSYVVQFREFELPTQPETEGPPPIQEEPEKRQSVTQILSWLAPIMLLTGVVLGWLIFRPSAPKPTSFDQFWQPFTSSSNLTICLPTPEVFRIYGDNREELIRAFKARSPEKTLEKLPNIKDLQDIKIIPETGLFLGLGDAQAVGMVQALAISYGKNPAIRQGNITTFGELRAGPSVLIGGMTNRWTMDMLKNQRFEFVVDNRHSSIRDMTTQRDICVKPSSWEQPSTEDCAVVMRLLDSKTGHPILVAAGLDHFGTLAVGEFITQPKLLQQAIKNLPAGWEKKNVQIVFMVEKVRDSVGPPKNLMTHVW